MPSFDVVSEIDKHELSNAIDQANREISNRFDFKGTNTRIEHDDNSITIIAPSEFQVKQAKDIFDNKLAKRDIDSRAFEYGDVKESNNEAKMTASIKQGIDKELAKKMVRMIKDSKIKVQSTIQDQQLRVNGKKRDDLQQIITLLKEAKIEQPLQFTNFRD